MGYASLQECVADLERARDLVRIDVEVDPRLEAGEIQRRALQAGGPALLFTRVKGTKFPMLANLFGSKKRAEFLFRDALAGVRALVSARVDPSSFVRSPGAALRLPGAALHLLPRRVRSGPVLDATCRVSDLPELVSWPDDGGPFVTLPQVYTEDPDEPGVRRSNLGMYRIQLSGNDYARDREIGLHYQLHRGIGIHHAKAEARGAKLPVAIFVGGPPSMTLAAVMPLPEGMPEIHFAGALGGRAIRMIAGDRERGLPSIHADADFCIRGFVHPGESKPEGPFGDHLGYYSKKHDFPVLHVDSVHHREGAIWPFTTVGRPPQEDTIFGEIIHELTAPLVPEVLPGVRAVHAVDASGVHPLLLAIGSERYTPYAKQAQPMELLTQASAILGNGQMSLAKYLFIADGGDEPPPLADVDAFFRHVLERVDPARDLHFHVNTTMDTLDYSGTGLNLGSKLVVAVCGAPRRALATAAPRVSLPVECNNLRVVFPGVLALSGPRFGRPEEVDALCEKLRAADFEGFPLVVLCDDADFVARSLANFLWVTFTRSNPAVDVHGVGAFTTHKAWGCRGPIVIDARTKPHHAPALEMDRAVVERVDRLFAAGGPLASLPRGA